MWIKKLLQFFLHKRNCIKSNELMYLFLFFFNVLLNIHTILWISEKKIIHIGGGTLITWIMGEQHNGDHDCDQFSVLLLTDMVQTTPSMRVPTDSWSSFESFCLLKLHVRFTTIIDALQLSQAGANFKRQCLNF